MMFSNSIGQVGQHSSFTVEGECRLKAIPHDENVLKEENVADLNTWHSISELLRLSLKRNFQKMIRAKCKN